MQILGGHPQIPTLSSGIPVKKRTTGMTESRALLTESRPMTSLKPRELGVYTVRFSGTAPLSPAELEKLNEEINDLNSHVRLTAIKKLYDQPEITDTRILRSLGRYVFYNDVYYPLDRVDVQARLWAIKLLEKHKVIWGAEGLYNNLREVGNRSIANYAGAVLGRIFPTMPSWMQDRYRARLYDWVISNNSSAAPSISASILAEVAPKEDANYVWYLIDMPGILSEDSNNSYGGFYGGYSSTSEGVRFRERLSSILASLLTKEKGAGVFQATAQELQPLIAQDDRSDKDLRYKKRLYTAILSNLPDYALRNTSQEPAQVKELLGTSLGIFETFQKTSLMNDVNTRKYLSTIAKLTLKLPKTEQQPYIDQLMKLTSGLAEEKEVVATLFEVLYQGEFNRTEIITDYLNKKYHYNYEEPNAKERFIKALRERIQQVQDNNRNTPVQSYLPLLSEPNAIFKASSYVRRADDKFTSGSDLQFNPTDFADIPTSEKMFGFNLPDPVQKDWSPKFKPAPEPPATWTLEPFQPRPTTTEVNFYAGMTQQFKTALTSEVRSSIQDVLSRTMQVWLNNGSRAAYDVLKENIGNPIVFEQFNTMLWRLDDPKLKTVPAKQYLSLMREAAKSKPIKNDTSGEMFRSLISWQAKNNPQLSGELMQTTLEMFQAAPDNSPATSYAARSVFNILKFGIPDWVVQKHPDTVNRLLKSLSVLYDMDSSSSRRDMDWSFFSNTTWETSSESDRSSIDQKKNFDLLLQLAIKAQNRESLERGIRSIANYYQRVQRTAYADEIFVIRYLRNPQIIEAGLNLEDERQFQQFREMLAWYKVFEAIPQMIQKAAKGPLATTSWLVGTITAMDIYAVPELEKIIATATNPKEQAIAKQALAQVLEPKRPSELFKPFAYGLPEIFSKTPTPSTGQTSGVSNNTQIAFPGLFDSLPPAPPVTPPEENPNPLQPPPQTEEPVQVRFPGMLDETTLPGVNNENLSYLELMNRALVQLRGDNAAAKQQALNDLAFFAQQFRVVSSARGSSIPFVTPEKTAIARTVSELLAQSTDLAVQRGLINTLSNLQDPVSTDALLGIVTRGSDTGLRRSALEVLGSLGRADSRAPIRNLALSETEPMDVRQEAVRAMIRLDDRDALIALSQSATVSEPIRLLGVQGIGELRIDTPEARTALLSLLGAGTTGAAPAGSELKTAAIRALGQMADSNDTEVATRLIAAAAGETPALKMAVINAFEFLDYTDAVREFIGRMRQDSDYNVSRAAAQFQMARQ